MVRNLKYPTDPKIVEREDETNCFSVNTDPYFKKNIAEQLKIIYAPFSIYVSLTLQFL